jgi:hypothetical protein
MIAVKIEGDKFLARCERCRRWLEVEPRCTRSNLYFAYWERIFSCCDNWQTAVFTIEKDEVDIH